MHYFFLHMYSFKGKQPSTYDVNSYTVCMKHFSLSSTTSMLRLSWGANFAGFMIESSLACLPRSFLDK